MVLISFDFIKLKLVFINNFYIVKIINQFMERYIVTVNVGVVYDDSGLHKTLGISIRDTVTGSTARITYSEPEDLIKSTLEFF